MYLQANLRSQPSIEIPNSYARSRSSLARVSCFAGTSIYLGSRRDFWLWAGWFPICIRPCATVQLGLRHCTNGAGGGGGYGCCAGRAFELASFEAASMLLLLGAPSRGGAAIARDVAPSPRLWSGRHLYEFITFLSIIFILVEPGCKARPLIP